MFKENIYDIISFGHCRFKEFLRSGILHIVFRIICSTNYFLPSPFVLIKLEYFNYSIFVDSAAVFGFFVDIEINNCTVYHWVKVSNSF